MDPVGAGDRADAMEGRGADALLGSCQSIRTG